MSDLSVSSQSVNFVFMGLEATQLGIQVFFYFILPGFLFFISFRFTGGFREKTSELGALCGAVFFGVLLFLVVKGVQGSDLEKFNELLANPFSAGIGLGIIGLVTGFIVGIPFGWIRNKLR